MPQTFNMHRSRMVVLGDDLSASIHGALCRLAAYRIYRRSVSEMSHLSGHELADLGLQRSAIRQVAHETVYGQRS